MQRSNAAGLTGVNGVPARRSGPSSRLYPGAPEEVPSDVFLRGRRLLTRGVFGLALLLLLIAAMLGGMRSVYADRIYPAVAIDQVDVGGKDVAAARAAVQSRVDDLEQGTVVLTYGGRTWSPSLAEIGVTFDLDRSLDQAYAIGREATARDRLLAVGSLVRHDRYVPLVAKFDQAVLNTWLDGVDAELGLPPHDASLTIDGTTVSIVPEVDGTIVDREAAARLVVFAARSLQPVNAPLPVVARVAKVRAADLASARSQVEAMLSRPVKLTFLGKKWTLDPADLAPFITQRTDPESSGAAALTIGVDQDALAKWLSAHIAADVNSDPVNAKIAWDDDTKSVVVTDPGVDGNKLKPKTLAGQVVASLLGDHGTVEVPVATIKPDVDSNNLGALGITKKLATGDSNYEGSNEGRATNIEVGSGLLNGTLIPPGGEFSFNHAIGVIEQSKGFVVAPVIDGERIGRDVGGGICQVSTTVFRAALKSGMPIVEWWPHTYRLAFYEQDGWAPGIDASILQPEGDPFGGGDFRFTNATDSWLLVESYTRDNRVYVILYGADLNDQVTLSDPQLSDPIPPPKDDLEIVDDELPDGTVEQTEQAQEGLEVVFDRTVTDKDGSVILQDTYDTKFDSRPNVWKVSPDMEGKSPASERGSEERG